MHAWLDEKKEKKKENKKRDNQKSIKQCPMFVVVTTGDRSDPCCYLDGIKAGTGSVAERLEAAVSKEKDGGRWENMLFEYPPLLL